MATDADFARRRAEQPIGPAGEGTHLSVRHDHVMGVLRDDRSYRPEQDPAVPPAAAAQWAGDPAEHRRRRTAVFAPQRIDAVVPAVIEAAALLVEDAVDESHRAGSVELVGAVLEPLAVAAIGSLLGILVGDRPAVFAAVDRMAQEATHADGEAELGAWLDGELARRASATGSPGERPVDDGLAILQVVDAPTGREASRIELLAYVYLICRSGVGPLRRLLANLARRLAADPEELADAQRPAACAALVEAVLRDDPPIQFLMRTPIDDVVIDGYAIAAGERLVMSLRSANADRAGAGGSDRHLSFGRGERYCPAATLGRTTTAILGGTLAARLDRIEIVDPSALVALEALSVWTPATLPVRLVTKG